MKRTKSMHYACTIEAKELFLYADNDSVTYYYSFLPVMKNLHKKHAKGTFCAEKAIDAFYHVAEYAAARYCAEFACGPVSRVFSVTDRFSAACLLYEAYKKSIASGDF